MQGVPRVEVGKRAQAPDIAVALGRYRAEIEIALRTAVKQAAQLTPRAPVNADTLATLYGQLEYHLGWRDADFQPEHLHPGKQLRPALTLLAAELTGGRAAVTQALGLAASIELIHNFSLAHDDIEDGDESRRGRPTLWKLWGQAQGINTGDALFALARLPLWDMPQRGVAPETVIRLARLVDLSCLELCEGQHLDMSFEGQRSITEAKYLDMIGRKTAALMACAAECGARVGAPEDEALGDQMGKFGRALGLAFQLRDDVLGIWSATELGKSAAGDIRRKKMTLPIIQALEHGTKPDRVALAQLYGAPGPATDAQIERTMVILDRSGSRDRAYAALNEQIAAARTALTQARATARVAAMDPREEIGGALESLVVFVQADAMA
jgi:geranylgeranyl diphosphate synthase type I